MKQIFMTIEKINNDKKHFLNFTFVWEYTFVLVLPSYN